MRWRGWILKWSPEGLSTHIFWWIDKVFDASREGLREDSNFAPNYAFFEILMTYRHTNFKEGIIWCKVGIPSQSPPCKCTESLIFAIVNLDEVERMDPEMVT